MDDPKAQKLCPSCGFLNPPGMKFCGNCGARLVQPEPPPAPPELLPERIGVMMGPDLRERFRKAGMEATGHRRAVTILFVDLTGFTPLSEKLESEQLYELLQEFIAKMVDTVYRYEGMVDKLTGDGLMALFGAPISHENNAERALRSALDMHQAMEGLNKKWNLGPETELTIHIGIHDGEVILGGMGGTGRLLNYTAVGDSVNVAKRLEESASPGSTFVSETVQRQAEALFDFERLLPLTLKGKTSPVPAFKLLGPRSRPAAVRGLKGLHSRMVGRESELKQLETVVRGLEHKKQGGLVLVMGEAGIGKSRLTRELKGQLRPHAVRVLEGQTLTYRKSIPYWVFQDLMRNYLGASASLPSAELRSLLAERLRQVMGTAAEAALPYLENMLALEQSGPAAGALSHLDAEQLHRQISLAMRDLLTAEAVRNPMLLILEDMHWADDSSISLLMGLLEAVNRLPLVIYVISRPFEEGSLAKVRDFGRQKLVGAYTEIALRSLEPEQSAQLLSSLLPMPQIPQTLSAEIIQRSAGLPFFMEEMLRVLIEKKVIFQAEGAWQLNPAVETTGLGVPETLQNLILARFDRLDPEDRLVLQTASVIGFQFGLPVLKTVLAENLRPQLGRIIQFLSEREFITPLAEAGEESYSFRHALMSDAIYGTLLQRTRKELHGKIGSAIELLYQDRLEDQAELLASHFQVSFLLEKALHYLILAGQKAARRFANAQSRQHFEAALSLLDSVAHSDEQTMQVHEGLGESLLITGDYQGARGHFEAVLELIHARQPAREEWSAAICEQAAMHHRKIATTFERQGDYEKALAQLSQAQQILDKAPAPAPVEQASVLNDLGWIYFRRGNPDLAENYLLEALPLVENTADYAVTASIYNRLGGIKFQQDQLDLTVEYTLKGLALREKIGDTAAVARSYNNLGLISWKAGSWSDALSYLERSFNLQLKLGDAVAMIDLHTNQGLLQLDRGETQQAEYHLKQALAESQLIGHGRLIAQAYLNLTFYSVQTGEWKAALDYSRQSQARYQEIGVKDELVELYTYMGMACLGQGNIGFAEHWGQEALSLFDQLGMGKSPRRIEDQGRAQRLLGDAACWRGEWTPARQYYEQSMAAFSSVNNRLEYGRSVAALAQTARNFDDLDPAALLKEARQIFTQLGAALDLKKMT
jgi:adenylate cyclase